jgi:thiamine pyrophosphate-dependent acetolactate synthase large subunit-like protein|tara:strand:- start:1632 stop:2186 length:555 start_codon:yes stop_codon:yes gene_type:complete
MIRKEAITILADFIKNNPVISANGHISRELFNVYDKNSNFYMIGSMGLASSIGLGVALSNPKKKIFIFDGDGNILMNLGSFTTIGYMQPKNLIHIIFDNSSHASTGGQPTSTTKIHLEKIAQSCNYKIFTISTSSQLSSILKILKNSKGPILLLIKISNSKNIGKRISLKPQKIKERFMISINK